MGIHQYTWVYMGIHEYTWVYMGIHEYTAWVYISIHGYTWVYMSIHEYTWVFNVTPEALRTRDWKRRKLVYVLSAPAPGFHLCIPVTLAYSRPN